MHLVEELQYSFMTIGQFGAMPWISARLQLSILCIHIPLNGCQMPYDVREREAALPVGPVKLVRGNAIDYLQSSFSDSAKVVQKRSYAVNLHFAPQELICREFPICA
jgi:hypothetical protein